VLIRPGHADPRGEAPCLDARSASHAGRLPFRWSGKNLVTGEIVAAEDEVEVAGLEPMNSCRSCSANAPRHWIHPSHAAESPLTGVGGLGRLYPSRIVGVASAPCGASAEHASLRHRSIRRASRPRGPSLTRRLLQDLPPELDPLACPGLRPHVPRPGLGGRVPGERGVEGA